MTEQKYIFDFDGTLVDSMRQWSDKILNTLKKYQVSYPPDIIKIITPLGDVGIAEYFINVLGIDRTVEELICEMDEIAMHEYKYNIELKDGVFDYLKMLYDEGISLNILTASPHRMLDVCLKRCKVYDFFDNAWSCDDFNLSKSDVRIYEQVLEKLGVTPENAVFFDDNIRALETAKKAGLLTVGVYDETAEEFTEQMKETADLYIEGFSGLKKINFQEE